MRSTLEFLDAVKARHSLTSDYSLAPILGVTKQEVSKLRNSKAFLGDQTAIQVAKLLEIDPAEVLSAVHAERAKTPAEKAAWASIFQRITTAACGVLLGVSTISPPPEAPAGEGASSVYYVKRRRPSRKGLNLGIHPLFPRLEFFPSIR